MIADALSFSDSPYPDFWSKRSEPLICLFFPKTCLQAVEVLGQQDPVSCVHTPLSDDLARPSLRIHPVLLHGVLHHHCRETGMIEIQGRVQRDKLRKAAVSNSDWLGATAGVVIS